MSSRNSPLPSLAGTKRKRNTSKKYYAVQVGKEPGVYDSWDKCLEQVKGQRGAVFKSFPSFTDAKLFSEGKLTDSAASSPIEQKFYGVAKGKVPGVYTDWLSAQAQISGFKLPKYKKFTSREEAEHFVSGEGDEEQIKSSEEARNANTLKSAPGILLDGDYIAKDKQGNIYEPGRGPLPSGAEDGFDPNIRLESNGEIVNRTVREKAKTKMVPKENDPPAMLRIYTDGSSLKNGQTGARAGVGVYFGPQNPNNVSEALKGSRQTNQRAELTAVQRALQIAPTHRDATIYTDSKYTIDCVTNWYKAWVRNGWVNSKGKPVENRDLIQDIREKMEERDLLRKVTEFVWVKGHANDAGNIAADRLAVQGAMSATGVNDDIEHINGTKSVRDKKSEKVQDTESNDDEAEASWQLLNESIEAEGKNAEYH